MKTIGLACDHAGYELKEYVKTWLEAKGWEYKDFGTYSTDSCDYPDFAHQLAVAVEAALGGTVENLPVQKPSVAPKTDRAGADSSEREGNIVGFPAFVGSANHSCYRLSGFFISL